MTKTFWLTFFLNMACTHYRKVFTVHGLVRQQ